MAFDGCRPSLLLVRRWCWCVRCWLVPSQHANAAGAAAARAASQRAPQAHDDGHGWREVPATRHAFRPSITSQARELEPREARTAPCSSRSRCSRPRTARASEPQYFPVCYDTYDLSVLSTRAVAHGRGVSSSALAAAASMRRLMCRSNRMRGNAGRFRTSNRMGGPRGNGF